MVAHRSLFSQVVVAQICIASRLCLGASGPTAGQVGQPVRLGLGTRNPSVPLSPADVALKADHHRAVALQEKISLIVVFCKITLEQR